MNAWLGAFSAGVILLYCTGRVLPGHDYLFAPVLIFVILMALVLRPRFSVLFFFLLLGWAYASFRAQSVIEQRVPSTYLQQTLIASGYACSLPRRSLVLISAFIDSLTPKDCVCPMEMDAL